MTAVTFLDGYCSAVQGVLDWFECGAVCCSVLQCVAVCCNVPQGVLDWFEVDVGFTELLLIQIDLCVMI